MEYLYVLKLQQEKWYVGKSANVERRFQQHKEGKGARWTQLHQPIELLYKRKLLNENDEDETTEFYMKKFGVENVRGGKYCQVEMPSNMISSVSKKVEVEEEYACDYCDRTFTTRFGCSVHEKSCQKTAVPECFRCGRAGHFKADCYARSHVNGYSLN
jgi:predicted GIY-YIG superfamily endonuclease